MISVGGLAAGTIAAVAGNRAWVSVDDAGSGDSAFATALSVSGDLTAPPVTATALVLLATWGVVLVTRGRPRRAVAWLGLVAALAVLGFALAAWVTRPGEVADDLRNLDVALGRTTWSYLGVVAGLGTVVTSVLAVRGVASWPEMGRRYDAPTGADGSAPVPLDRDSPLEEQSSIDLWKALDEGRDPTD
jgi:uncharacterized membrane protein (TIGR02234 family)